MKLRRAMAAAAATAVIAPLALLVSPAAYADGETSSSPTASASTSAQESTGTSPEPSGSTSAAAPGGSPSASASASDGTSASASPSASTSPSASASAPADPEDPEESEAPEPEPSECAATTADLDISGLPGSIAAGSGWHAFTLHVLNDTGSTLSDLVYLVGAAAEDGDTLFTSGQVRLQAYDPEDKTWYDLSDEGYAVGWAGGTDVLKPDYEVEVPLRIDVAAGAPVGSAFTLGATLYVDEDLCFGAADVSYEFQIAAAGTDTSGTEPQTGGKAPVTGAKPSATTPRVTGSLATTGAGSALPALGLAGGFAVVAGAGAVFAVRRRKVGARA